jgi:hypothetical protein
LITELEIGAIGTDISRRTSWWAREDLGKARTRKSMKNSHCFEMYTNIKCSNMFRIHIFLDETGCVLNEKMMPDLTATVPELEIDRKVSNINVSKEKCAGPGMLSF